MWEGGQWRVFSRRAILFADFLAGGAELWGQRCGVRFDEHYFGALVVARCFVADERPFLGRIEPGMQLWDERRDNYVDPSEVRPHFDSERLLPVGSKYRRAGIASQGNREYLGSGRAIENMQAGQFLLSGAQIVLHWNHDAGAGPGIVGEFQHILGVACSSAAGMGADCGARSQIDMRAFHYGAIGVVKCMVEFDQLRHPVADSDQRCGLDVGLAVVEAGLSVQDSAVNGALDAVFALSDYGAGIGIQY